ncbi:MAG: glycine zipper domain-containing protein [Candidatus Dadabacteria bacterium]
MKFSFLVLFVIVLVSACNQSPKAVETTTLVQSDSTYVNKPELPVANQEALTTTTGNEQKKSSVTPTHHANNSTTTHSGTTHSSSTASGNSSSSSAAPAKKGWSKTAKGAVIGGVVGAGTGAVVNKRNRGVGAVIGGALGAGAGAVIGNQMDKKDGRH